MNQDTAAGQFDQLKGKVKQAVGEAVGNDKLANSGAADQVKGAAKEAWGNTKDAAHAVADDVHARADPRSRPCERGDPARHAFTRAREDRAHEQRVDAEPRRDHDLLVGMDRHRAP